MGYSVGKWDGDEFVVTTAGVNDEVWNIDLAGHPHSDALRITERYKRVDFGHMDVNVTIDDSKTYASQWNMPVMRFTCFPTQICSSSSAKKITIRSTWGPMKYL